MRPPFRQRSGFIAPWQAEILGAWRRGCDPVWVEIRAKWALIRHEHWIAFRQGLEEGLWKP